VSPDDPSGHIAGRRHDRTAAGDAVDRAHERTVTLPVARDGEQAFRLAFEEAPIGMALIGLHGRQTSLFLRVNRSLCAITGYGQDELIGHSFHMLNQPGDELEAARRFAQLASGGVDRWDAERAYRHADGRALWLHVSSSLARDDQGRPAYALSQMLDVSARREAESRITHLALHDPLTDLPNRALLMDHIEAALERAARDQQCMAVLFLDLDDFKEVNDRLGHAAGDELLVGLAQRLRACLRGRDVVGRLGGDELVVVCEELRDPPEIHSVLNRIANAVGAPMSLHGETLRMTASTGVALNLCSPTPEALLHDADAAMYRAKARGPGLFEIADSHLQAGAARRLDLLEGLRTALEDHQLRLDYQPCVDLATGRLVSAEALLRWDHPVAGELLPSEFLLVAERDDLAESIGGWVIGEACRQAATWEDELGAVAPDVWVNISSRQLGRQRLPRLIRETCARHGLRAHKLGLDIPESQVTAIAQPARAELHNLRGMGVQLAVDDFRIGQNSIRYLSDLPIDVLKLERSLVDGLGTNRADTAVTRSAATLADGLQLGLVAKGVETTGQRDLLRELGCGLGQGYLFGRPDGPEAVSHELA
jgi:diguanylate cyclase (GGDEF)-like protein/PAS domain S-box-containing protein